MPEASTSSRPTSIRSATTLTAENHTLKRALTDPRLLSGIGNAYSDEILHAAQLSPIALTQKLKPEEWERLFTASRETLQLWIDRLRAEAKAPASPKRSQHFARVWQYMGVMASRAPGVATRSCAFATRTKRPTTAPAARLAEGARGSQLVAAVGIGLAAHSG